MLKEYQVLEAQSLFKTNEKIYIQKSTSLPKYVGIMHSHDFIEIVYIISGECDHIEYSNRIRAKKGDLFIINYGVPHANCPLKSQSVSEPFVAYDCAFVPSFLDDDLNTSNDFKDVKASHLLKNVLSESTDSAILSKMAIKGKNFFDIEELLSKMLSEFTMKKIGYYDILRAYLIELIVLIARQSNESENADIGSKQEYYIELALQYVHDNFTRKITLDTVACRSMLSKSYFSKLFKNKTGQCFSEYLQKLRIKRACELLTQTHLSIADICEQSGFSDVKFFYSIFKKALKKSPGEYRAAKQ